MSNTPVVDPLQQPPPMVMEQEQQAYSSRPGHGSVGPVIGVLAVIAVLGAIAVMIGRLCSGRRFMGRGQYDFESWAETKCASCIDGRVDPPQPRPEVAAPAPVPEEAAAQPQAESKEEEAAAHEENNNNNSNNSDGTAKS